jgi:hypothetical protein
LFIAFIAVAFPVEASHFVVKIIFAIFSWLRFDEHGLKVEFLVQLVAIVGVAVVIGSLEELANGNFPASWTLIFEATEAPDFLAFILNLQLKTKYFLLRSRR